MIKYDVPHHWIRYDATAVMRELTEAKASVMSLLNMPFQRSWAEKLQDLQLKREVAGTSRIEGAEFTEGELEAAMRETPEQLFTRSQRQARAAKDTYRWISKLPDDRPINNELIMETHARIISGADDDHCPPGRIRERDQNVVFGSPPHRGAEGGEECAKVFARLDQAIQREFQDHDLLIQALALHYHFASIHPFLDGNGRTARAVEALVLQRAGLRRTLFIAMSNYYYDEKKEYLASLSKSRALDHDLTPFLCFGLRGIASQCQSLFREIKAHVSKALFRDVMLDLFNRLENSRKRVIANRQKEMLRILLEVDEINLNDLYRRAYGFYQSLSNIDKAFLRDISNLMDLDAIHGRRTKEGWWFRVNLDWPTTITETTFFEKVSQLPKAKTHPFF